MCVDLPSVRLVGGEWELVGWSGQLRNMTCVGRGLPLPSVQWLYRGGQQVNDNSAFTVVTSRTNRSVTSHLQVRRHNTHTATCSKEFFGVHNFKSSCMM